MTQLYITVTIDPLEYQRLDTLIQQFMHIGMQVGDFQTATGTITGTIDQDRLDDLRGIKGVLSVTNEASQPGRSFDSSIKHTRQTVPPLHHQEQASQVTLDQIAEQPVCVTVSVAEECLSHYDQVVAQCEEVGMQVEQRLDILGLITGLINTVYIVDLKHIEGVAAVELVHDYQIAPPDSDVQ